MFQKNSRHTREHPRAKHTQPWTLRPRARGVSDPPSEPSQGTGALGLRLERKLGQAQVLVALPLAAPLKEWPPKAVVPLGPEHSSLSSASPTGVPRRWEGHPQPQRLGAGLSTLRPMDRRGHRTPELWRQNACVPPTGASDTRMGPDPGSERGLCKHTCSCPTQFGGRCPRAQGGGIWSRTRALPSRNLCHWSPVSRGHVRTPGSLQSAPGLPHGDTQM